jgi:cbb3-type cytochrome oxidase subunit 3
LTAAFKFLLAMGLVSVIVLWLVHWASRKYKPDDEN